MCAKSAVTLTSATRWKEASAEVHTRARVRTRRQSFLRFTRRRLVRILGSIVLAQTLLAKTNEPLRNADIYLASIRLAKLATSRLANPFLGEFVHLSDLVCVVCLIA
jgi:hypothetical protein